MRVMGWMSLVRGPSCSSQYKLFIVRGSGAQIIAKFGEKFLTAANPSKLQPNVTSNRQRARNSKRFNMKIVVIYTVNAKKGPKEREARGGWGEAADICAGFFILNPQVWICV